MGGSVHWTLTHKTSLYKKFKEEQKALRRDARNPKYGDKGIGKGGKKQKSATTTKRTAGTIPIEHWQDKEVERAFTGGALPGAIRPSDSDAVVPHMVEEGSQSESSTQNIPELKLKQNAVESAKYAVSSVKAPHRSKITPGMRGIKEQQSKYNLIIPRVLFACVVCEICLDVCLGAKLHWEANAISALQ